MSVPSSHPPPQPEDHAGCLFNWFYLTLATLSACTWPFTRKHFGRLAFSLAGPGAMAWMYLFSGFCRGREMLYFFAAWFAVLLYHRAVTLSKLARGWECHSHYDGYPWLVRRLFWPKPEQGPAKGVCEPLLALVSGLLLGQAWPGVGLLLASSGLALALKQGIDASIEEKKLRAWKDKEIEMRYLFGRYRSRR